VAPLFTVSAPAGPSRPRNSQPESGKLATGSPRGSCEFSLALVTVRIRGAPGGRIPRGKRRFPMPAEPISMPPPRPPPRTRTTSALAGVSCARQRCVDAMTLVRWARSGRRSRSPRRCCGLRRCAPTPADVDPAQRRPARQGPEKTVVVAAEPRRAVPFAPRSARTFAPSSRGRRSPRRPS